MLTEDVDARRGGADDSEPVVPESERWNFVPASIPPEEAIPWD